MSVAKTVRVKKRSMAVIARPTKRRSPKARRPRAAAAETDSLLIAKFAEALGATSTRKPRADRRSLMSALADSNAHAGCLLDVMPGARVVAVEDQRSDIDHDLAREFRVLAHRRHCRVARLKSAGSWGLAAVISALIVSVAAAGILAQAPSRVAAGIMKTASAAQF